MKKWDLYGILLQTSIKKSLESGCSVFNPENAFGLVNVV